MNIKAIVVDDLDDFEAGPSGVVMFDSDCSHLFNKCPKCGRQHALSLKADDRPHWQLVSSDPITLRPSIVNPCCGWHGYLAGGIWTPC